MIWATLCFEADERTNKNKSHINTKNMGRRKDGWARCSGCPEWAHSCSGKQLTSDQLTWLLSSTWAAHGLETSSNLKETKKQTFRFNCMFFLSNCNWLQLHVTDYRYISCFKCLFIRTMVSEQRLLCLLPAALTPLSSCLFLASSVCILRGRV